MTDFYLTGVRLALRSSGLTKIAENSADELAAALHGLGEAPPRTQPQLASDTTDPKDPDDTKTVSSFGPFAGDTLTSLGLNTGTTDFLSY
jgi:hypothetical protein